MDFNVFLIRNGLRDFWGHLWSLLRVARVTGPSSEHLRVRNGLACGSTVLAEADKARLCGGDISL